MVDAISNAKGIRAAGASRYGASPASSPTAEKRAIAPVAPTGAATRRDQDGSGEGSSRDPRQDGQDLRLEIAEDEGGKELVYRFVDALTGDVVREWDAGQFGRLRDYMRDKKIHLLDKKI